MEGSSYTTGAKTNIPAKKGRVLNYSRILISLALLAFIVLKNYKNFDEIYKVLTSTVSLFIAFALITHLFMLFIESLRWHVLLYAQGERVSRAYLFHSMMIGYFYNNLLPSNIGGDFFRIYDIAKNRDVPVQKSASAVFIERFLGLITITIFFAATSFSIYRLLKNYVITITVFLAIAFVLFILLSKPQLFKIDRFFKKFKKLDKAWLKIKDFSDAVTSYKNKLPALFLGLFLNIASQLLFTIMFYFISIALGLNVSFLTYAFMVPVIFVIIGIPISIGGLGVRENLIVFLLSAVGVQNEKAVVFSLVVLFIHIFNAVLGGIAYLTRNIFFRSKGFI
ncbi:MAG: flippase-like domain-containing protein [Actinobacteria bacterium]|nr:flippase-like domain-containing protein [Actinomycetota bacterium]